MKKNVATLYLAIFPDVLLAASRMKKVEAVGPTYVQYLCPGYCVRGTFGFKSKKLLAKTCHNVKLSLDFIL